MTLRYYILPLERVGSQRGPKYLKWRYDPDPPGLDVRWGLMDYGALDVGLVMADVTIGEHSALAGEADVLAWPEDLDQTIPLELLTGLGDALEAFDIPADWLTVGHTYRQALRTVAGMLLFGQRLHGLHNRPLLEQGRSLDSEKRNLSTTLQSELSDTAQSLGYNLGSFRETTTLRTFLRTMGEAWGSREIKIGGVSV